MQEYLEEIQASPGVMGSCLYSAEQGIIASNLPAAFKEETQQRIAGVLHRIFRLNEKVDLDVSAFEIQYEEALILVKKLCEGSSLLVICEPSANTHLVTMTISMLTADLQGAISDCQRQPATQQPRETDPEKVMQGDLAGELGLIKKTLAESIGPVAGMTLKGYLKQWLEQGPAEKHRLPELIESLLPEIDDAASRKEFSKRLKTL